MSIRIKGGRIVTHDNDFVGDILIEDETITQIGTNLSHISADETIDATGKLVIPGGIDPHCHNDMPYNDSITTTDTFETGSRAAAHGGTTTHIEFCVQQRGHSTLEALEQWHAKAEGRANVDYAFHMIITDMDDRRVDELDELVARGVPTFKMFTAYPDRLYVDDRTIFRVMQRTAQLGGMVLMHAENGIAIDAIVQKAVQDGHTTPDWHAKTRPSRLEAEAVHRTFAMAEVTNCPTYIVHLSCVESLEEVQRARMRGVPAFAETCPQYLVLDDSLYSTEFESSKWVMTPCLRPQWHQEILWRGLRNGDLQTTGTDHCPLWFDGMKTLGRDDFTQIPNGAPGIENRMALLYDAGVVDGRLSLQQFVAVTSTNAAKLFGMFPRKGTIAVGSDADIVIFNPERNETISINNPVTHNMNIDYSAYEGVNVRGYPETVLSRGAVIVRDTRFVGTPGRGRFIHRHTSGQHHV
jgi:dihydropyrimidinase